ncbi:MAG: TRAP transporter large permease [Peptostreptococcaceae bacterium]|nr:TRAP transporter large permease [Peptostreptococcaceae bacterium]
MSAALLLFIAFVALLIVNVPIAICLGFSSILTMLYSGVPMSLLPNQMYANIGKFTLLAIPFFILAGNIMEKAQISDKLINFANKTVGHRKGGLAIVCIITSCFFAAISGSGPATVAALGVVLIPAMVNAGYGKGFAGGLMATSGSIGVIIPPSICYVVYGAISGVSIGKMFIAGIVPGILMGLALIVSSHWILRGKELVKMEKASGKEKWKAFQDAFWGILMPIIILGGIYSGVFTPTESAAVAAVYGLLVGLFIYKTIKVKDLYRILVDSGVQSAVIMIIVACASLFAWLCSTEGIARQTSDLLLSISGNKIIFLLIVNIILLIAGCFIDANSAMYIFVPIILPVAQALDYDLIALGVFMTMNLAVGMVTPPMGVNLYVGAGIAGIDLKTISKAVMPFIIASLAVLLLITYVPQVTTFLPELMKIK